jgi:chromosome segregation ATPase
VELERTYRELYRSHEELRTACGELQRSHAELQRADEERQRAHGELQESHAQLETAYEEIDRSITDQANEIQLVATEIEALSELNSRLPVPRWQTKITLAPNDPGCGHFPPIAELGARLTQLERQYRDIGAQSPPTGSCHSHTAMITFLTAIIVRLENGLLELGHDEGSGPSGATGD